MRNSWTLLAIVTFCVLALTTLRVEAQSVQPTSKTYSWSGEFVEFDATSRTLTVKARVVGEHALKELPQFKSGDRIVLTWSGYDMYADGVSRVVRYDAGKKWNEPFTFPVEFVAYGTPNQYVTFKFQVPEASVAAVKAVTPGHWITAIARHRPENESETITAVNAYTASASPASTN